jgi:hypothetical protein
MNNVVYVDFKQKALKPYNKRESLKTKWDRVDQLDKWITSTLTIKQFDQYTKSTNFMVRAQSLKKITKSFKLNKHASEMIDLINEIRLEQNTMEKVYTSNDVPF